jgi:hypothetical protein
VKWVLFTNDYFGHQPKEDATGSIRSMQEIDQEKSLLLENMTKTTRKNDINENNTEANFKQISSR